MVSLKPIYVELLDRYATFLRVCGRSPKTVFAYTAVVTRFLPVQADGHADDPVRRYLRTRDTSQVVVRLAAHGRSHRLAAIRLAA